MLIKNRPGKNRPVFIRQPVQCTLELLAKNWLRLEQRWEDNPGFVAAAVAGSLGLLLTAAMVINAGFAWLQETPAGDELAVESPDFGEPGLAEPGLAESDLGDSSTDEFLVRRGRNFVARRKNQDTNAYRAGDDDSGDQSDPFAQSRTPARRIDDDEATEEITDRSTPEPEQVPEQVQVTGTLPVQKHDAFDDDEESAPDEPVAQRPLAELRVASQPQVLQPLEMDDEVESSIADTDQPAGTESKSAPLEPARLKPASQPNIANEDSNLAKPVENDDRVDDDRLERDRSIDLVRAPPDRTVSREDIRWRQQRTKSVAESAPPAVAARQSRPVETKIFAAPQARSVPVVKDSRTPRERSAAPPLSLAISGPPSVGVGQPCHFEIRVTNAGSVPAHHLVFSVELPPGLVHDVAQSLEQQIDTLAPGCTYRALLRLRGEAVGEKTIRAEVGTIDQAALQLSAKVQVTSTTSAAAEIGPLECFRAPLVR